MAMDLTIDVDEYELSNGRKEVDDVQDHDTLTDFRHLEIIDDGISEEEFEEISTPSKETSSTYPKTNHFYEKTSIISSDKLNNCKSNDLSVKVVDIYKYPWYYPKYKNQILGEKYSDARKHARFIVKSLKMNQPVLPVIDLDDSSDSSASTERDTTKYSTLKKADQESESFINKQPNIEKNYRRKKNTSYLEMIRIQQIISKREISSGSIDIKRNKGLIGMKVRKLPQNEISKQNCTEKVKYYNGKARLQKHTNSSISHLNKIDAAAECLCCTTNPDLDKIKMPRENTTKLKNVDLSKKKSKKYHEKQPYALKCSLKINSPNILMKIRKVTEPEEKNINKFGSDKIMTAFSIKDNIAYCQIEQIKNHNDQNSNDKDHTSTLGGCKNIVKYKPMPKSKRLELEKRENLIISKETQKIAEDQTNKKEERHETLITKHTSSLTSVIKHCTNNEKITGIISKEKDNEDYDKTFIKTNKFTEKILKLAKMNLGIIDNISKARSKKEVKKTDKVRKRKVLDVFANRESDNLKTVVPTFNLENEDEEIMKCNIPTTTQVIELNTTSVSSNTTTNSDECNTSEHQKISLVNKNTNNSNISTLIKSKQSDDGNTILRSPKTLKSSNNEDTIEYNLTTFKIEPDKVDNSINTSLKDVLMSISSSIQPAKKENTLKLADKQPEYNLCLKDTSNTSPSNKVSECINSNLEINATRKTILQSSKMEPQIGNCSLNISNPDEYILSDIAKNNQANNTAAINDGNVSLDSQTPVRITQLLPSTQTNITRPNILRYNYTNKPYFTSRFRGLSAPLPGYIHNGVPHGTMPFTVRPQNFLRQVRHWGYNQNLPNCSYRPRSGNIQRTPWNNVHKYPATNYDQNNYIRPQFYNRIYQQGMPHNVHRPPGTCDVQPNNVYCEYNVQSPAPSTHQSPTQISYQAKCDAVNSSIIGINNTGAVKKINIWNLTHSEKNEKIDNIKYTSKPDDIETVVKHLTNSKTETSKPTKKHNDSIVTGKPATVSKNSNTTNATGKTIATIESPVKPELKRSCLIKQNKIQVNTSKRMSKKIKMSNKLTTPLNQITPMGYSPPILPIPSLQEVLSKYQIGVNVAVQLESPVKHSSTFKTSLKASELTCNVPSINTMNNQSKMKNDNSERFIQSEDSNKKISFEEYKKRKKSIK